MNENLTGFLFVIIQKVNIDIIFIVYTKMFTFCWNWRKI